MKAKKGVRLNGQIRKFAQGKGKEKVRKRTGTRSQRTFNIRLECLIFILVALKGRNRIMTGTSEKLIYQLD